MHWSSGLAKLTQETHTCAHSHMHARTDGHTLTQTFWSAAFFFAHAVQLISCWPALLKHRYTHTLSLAHKDKCMYSDALQMPSLTCNVSSWIKFMLEFRLISVATNCLSTMFQKINRGTFCLFFFFFFWLCCARTWQD